MNESAGQTYANNSNVLEISKILQDDSPVSDSVGTNIVPTEDMEKTIVEQDAGSSILNETDKIINQDDMILEGLEGLEDGDKVSINADITLKDLAKELNINSKDLYDVTIPMGDGKEPVKLGELKDSYSQFNVMKQQKEDFESNKTRSENELMTTRRQLEQIVTLAVNTGQLTPELLTQLESIEGQRMKKESNALMSAIPSWSDKITRENDFNNMVDELLPYGFSRVDIENVSDHRLVKYVHDNTKRNRLVADAKEKTKLQSGTGKNSLQFKKKQSKLQSRIQNAKKGSNTEKAQAITALLNN